MPAAALRCQRPPPRRPRAPRPSRARRAERRLAARLRAGDADTMAGAYEAYGAATFGFLVRMLGDRAAAEDVQQQVFTRSGGARALTTRAAPLLTWVLTIARSRAIDHLRRRVPEPRDPQLPDPRSVRGRADALLERWRLAQSRPPAPGGGRWRLRFYGELSQTRSPPPPASRSGRSRRDGARPDAAAGVDRGRGRMTPTTTSRASCRRGGAAGASGTRSGSPPPPPPLLQVAGARVERRRAAGSPLRPFVLRPALAVAAMMALVVLGAAVGALGSRRRRGRAPGARSRSRPWVTVPGARAPTPGCAGPPCGERQRPAARGRRQFLRI